MFDVAAPAADQAYEHGLRRHQQQGRRKTPKHIDDARHDDRIQARTGDVTTSASGPGRPELISWSLLATVLLSGVAMVTFSAAQRTRTTLDMT